MYTIWNNCVQMPTFDHLTENISTDVLVIGGGITGILCAYTLQQAGINTILVEAKKICCGVTGYTTAKITAQHGYIFDSLLRRLGPEQTRAYLDSNLDALKQYQKLSKNIDCDFVTQDSFLYAVNNTKLLEDECKALNTIGYTAEMVDTLPLPLPTAGGLCFQNQAQMNPLKLLSVLANKLKIYEHTQVLELLPGAARTNHGTIHSSAIIVATHFPFINKHGNYFLKLYQQRSYVLALKNTPVPDGMYIGAEYPNLSFRTYNGQLLFGGYGHRTGKNTGGWQALMPLSKQLYPDSEIAYHWATQDCMTLDGLPYVGQYSKNTPNLYVATGFQKWGMTSAMAAASILRDLLLNNPNPCIHLFSPSRTILRPQLFVNGFETAKNLLTFCTPRCSHLGCALKWNPQEHSWDCPCHGSRFSNDGTVLENPATRNSSSILKMTEKPESD